mmetsp:Transcript_13211/g.55345  ORF Transcript_13211/g.55345 Transcript_13211/m.55345 type:complete len:357 (-) Transcript_13211:1500-2570(-)
MSCAAARMPGSAASNAAAAVTPSAPTTREPTKGPMASARLASVSPWRTTAGASTHTRAAPLSAHRNANVTSSTFLVFSACSLSRASRWSSLSVFLPAEAAAADAALLSLLISPLDLVGLSFLSFLDLALSILARMLGFFSFFSSPLDTATSPVSAAAMAATAEALIISSGSTVGGVLYETISPSVSAACASAADAVTLARRADTATPPFSPAIATSPPSAPPAAARVVESAANRGPPSAASTWSDASTRATASSDAWPYARTTCFHTRLLTLAFATVGWPAASKNATNAPTPEATTGTAPAVELVPVLAPFAGHAAAHSARSNARGEGAASSSLSSSSANSTASVAVAAPSCARAP